MSLGRAFIDKLLTNVSIGYQPEGLVAERILPVLQVAENSGKLAKYGTAHLRIEHSTTGGRGQYRRVETMTRDTTSYLIESHGLEGMVTPEDIRNYDAPFKAESEETQGITNLLQLEKEMALATAMASTSVLTQNTTLSGTSQLSDYANSNALDVFSTARNAVRAGCGMVPNVAIMDWKVAEKLKYHPELLDNLGYKFSRPGGLQLDELAKALDVEEIVLAKGMYESAAEGASSSLSPIWGKHIVFAVCPNKPAPWQVALGYHVQLGQARKVYKFDIVNPPESKGIIVKDEYDQLITNPLAGYLIKDAIA